uniref:Uncharacterized protein n=1 Tax=Amphimedon queenslandica TaxID=400682 RepID=A0A1X7T6C0_AMPQE
MKVTPPWRRRNEIFFLIARFLEESSCRRAAKVGQRRASLFCLFLKRRDTPLHVVTHSCSFSILLQVLIEELEEKELLFKCKKWSGEETKLTFEEIKRAARIIGAYLI